MGLIFNNCSIRGIDVSGFNDVFNWNKAQSSGIAFSGIRVGYGRTTDTQFKTNWANSKGKVIRMPYWYMDYYSNWYNKSSPAYGLSNAAWGKEQAENCWKLIKDDPDCTIVWLDIESGGAEYSPPITTVSSRAQEIAKAFLERIDELNGKFNGIYCSVSMTTWFSTWFRNRPLWAAWYNEYQTPSSVLKTVDANGWSGDCLIWQYASDGDATDDGVGDGVSLGNPYKWLDLNWWISSSEKYKEFSNGAVITNPPIPEDGDNNDNTATDNGDTSDIPLVKLYDVKVLVDALYVRSSPYILSNNKLRVVGKVVLPIYKEENGFGKISPTNDEWISINYKYAKRLNPSLYTVTANSLYIRSAPTFFSYGLGFLHEGDQVQISASEGDSWGMLYDRDGYVRMKYVKKM